jgi:hypothetical protein
MYDQKRLQEIAALPSPVLTVYLNTASQDPSLHPVVPACLRWFTDEGEALSRTLLSRDGRRLKEHVERFERFLSLRRPQEKAIAAFVGPDVWKVLPLHICLESQLRWGKPSVTQLFKPPSAHKPYGIVVVDHHGAVLPVPSRRINCHRREAVRNRRVPVALAASQDPDPSYYLLYFNRSRSDALHGGFSGLARGQVKSRARKGALENLVNVQRSIEAQFAARPAN